MFSTLCCINEVQFCPGPALPPAVALVHSGKQWQTPAAVSHRPRLRQAATSQRFVVLYKPKNFLIMILIMKLVLLT
jgi:hypothetical protein